MTETKLPKKEPLKNQKNGYPFNIVNMHAW